MAGTQNSLTSALAQWLRLENNALTIVSNLSNAVSSSNETVQFTQTLDDGTVQTYLVPSFGFMQNQLNVLTKNVQQLSGLDASSSAVITLPDGTQKSIFTASILKDPAKITSLQVPSQFNIKNNWFFQNFLNPLLYITIDLTGLVTSNTRQAYVKRIILNTDTTDKQNFFDNNLNGKNDLDYATLLVDLNNQNISFFTDENIVDLPLQVMQFRGTFDVLKVFDSQVTITSNATTITTTKRNYKLSTLNYTDILSGTTNSKTLLVNDILITSDGTKYQITSIDPSQNSVILNRLSGQMAITIGTDVLSINSMPFTLQQLQVNVGHDERQVIFIKPIDPDFQVAASQYSPGIAFYSNNLTINNGATGSGIATSLDSFYMAQVSDFGKILIGDAKEQYIPSVYGETPNVPALDVSNFQVVQTNTQQKNSAELQQIQQLLQQKTQLSNQLANLDQAINTKKTSLNNSSQLSAAQQNQLKADITTLTNQRQSSSTQYGSVVDQLATLVQQNPAVTQPNKYAVRGFWPIPQPVTSPKTQPQEVIQFRVAYRYIDKSGNAPGTVKLDFVDNDGTTKSGYFSNWIEFKTPIRTRIYNTTTGFWEWAIEDVTNADQTNINQLDIPISQGEQLQVRMTSISEAGYPLNPIESAFSPIITVDFPDNLQVTDQSQTILANIQVEDARVAFTNDLNAKGLDLHLQSSFTNGQQYFAHSASDINSQFFDSSGKILNLQAQLKQMAADIATLQQIVAQTKGSLVVYLLDDAGNVTTITPKSTTKLFGGYYKDLIQSGSGTSVVYNNGQIITRNYTIHIENFSATPLELASMLPGGDTVAVPVSNPGHPNVSSDYDKNRRYDLVPLSLSSITTADSGSVSQVAPFQSQQVNSLFLYSRFNDVGLSNQLYQAYTAFNNNPFNPSYTYQGTLVGTNLTPVDGYMLVPFDPTFAVPGTNINPNVWNGTVTGTAANGGGHLSEFCIHVNHPDLLSATTLATYLLNTWTPATYQATFQPDPAKPGSYIMSYPLFSQAVFFEDDVTSPTGKYQLQQYEALIPPTGSSPFAATDAYFPPKLGFTNNDQFLIGKYSCGAYLYIAPASYTDIAVDGTTDTAVYTLNFGEQNGINIPLVFQFRCSDALGYVGGFRESGTITNITYTKKVGIDIQVKNQSLFSFDVELTAKYTQDSLVPGVYVPNVSLNRLSSIRTQQQSASSTSTVQL